MILRSCVLSDEHSDELRDSVEESKGGNVRLRKCRAGLALDLGGRVRGAAGVAEKVSSSEYDASGCESQDCERRPSCLKPHCGHW